MSDTISNWVSDNVLYSCKQKLCKRSSHMRTRLPKNNCVEKLSYFVKLQPGDWRQWTLDRSRGKTLSQPFFCNAKNLKRYPLFFCICYHLCLISHDIAIKSSKTVNRIYNYTLYTVTSNPDKTHCLKE